MTVFLEAAKQRGWVRPKGRQRTDSTHVVAAIRTLNRLETVGETLRHAPNVVAEVAPEWLRVWAPPAWYDRYSQRVEDDRLSPTPAERATYAEQVGADGAELLRQVDAAVDRPWLRDLPALALLREVWDQQYRREPQPPARPGAEAGAPGPAERLRWRTPAELPAPGDRIESPYDPEAHFATKRTTEWRGYKVYVTETCDQGNCLFNRPGG